MIFRKDIQLCDFYIRKYFWFRAKQKYINERRNHNTELFT